MDYATLSGRTVADAMHPGVLTCPPAAPLREAARLMARFRVHALVVCEDERDGSARGVRGVVSDADVVAAIDRGDVDGATAGACARTPLVVVRPEEPLRHVARLLHGFGVTHALVARPGSARPLGIVSSLDLARAVAAEPGAA